VRINVRKTVIGLFIAGVLGAMLFPFAIYFLGLALAPPRPVAETSAAPPFLGDAIWARIGGGRATEIHSVSPITFARFVACIIKAEQYDASKPGEHQPECQELLAGVEGTEYLSRMHMRDQKVPEGPRWAIGQFATNVWLTRSWTRAELLTTLAARGEFGAGLRGVEAAARHYFGRSAADLTLPQAAMLASFFKYRLNAYDPWCERAAAAEMRGRILQQMRDNLAIDDAALKAANASELELGPPPADNKPCRD